MDAAQAFGETTETGRPEITTDEFTELVTDDEVYLFFICSSHPSERWRDFVHSNNQDLRYDVNIHGQ